MQNRLFTILLIASLAQNLQILSSDNENDTQNKAVTLIQKIARGYITRKSQHKPSYASLPWRETVRYQYIEKPFWLTGDTLHERRVICSSRTDVIEYSANNAIVYRDRITVGDDYYYLPSCTSLPINHASAKNFLRIPDEIEAPRGILTKQEYRTLLAAAIKFAQDEPDRANEDYHPASNETLQSFYKDNCAQ